MCSSFYQSSGTSGGEAGSASRILELESALKAATVELNNLRDTQLVTYELKEGESEEKGGHQQTKSEECQKLHDQISKKVWKNLFVKNFQATVILCQGLSLPIV